jgi:hypothetical protein
MPYLLLSQYLTPPYRPARIVGTWGVEAKKAEGERGKMKKKEGLGNLSVDTGKENWYIPVIR